MKHDLTRFGADFEVVHVGACDQYLLVYSFSVAAIWPSRFIESSYLSIIIRASSATVESTVPLKPSIWIAIGHPSRTFPGAKASSSDDAVFVDFVAVDLGREELWPQAFDPLRFDCVSQNF